MYRAWQEADSPTADGAQPGTGFLEALHDDLNTPLALQCLHHEALALAQLSGEERDLAARRLHAGGQLLGLFESSAEDWFHAHAHANGMDDTEIESLLAARQTARADGDYAEADRIRDQLTAAGIAVEDQPDGSGWRRVM